MDQKLSVLNKKVADDLCELANFMGNGEDLADQLSETIRQSHRTIQQTIFSVLKQVIEDFAATPTNCTDLRNAAAHAWAKKVAEVGDDGIDFPYI